VVGLLLQACLVGHRELRVVGFVVWPDTEGTMTQAWDEFKAVCRLGFVFAVVGGLGYIMVCIAERIIR
jgi:hypothetical protein